MKRFIKKTLKWYLVAVVFALQVFWVVWIFLSEREMPLSLWHTFVPDEMTASEIARADWAEYGRREEQVMEQVRQNVTRKLPPAYQVPSNRYFEHSPLNPDRFKENWNRSYVLAPQGKPAGAVVLLHGLTDSPYSLRHIAKLYRDNGFVAVGIRLPGHGTVPAALTRVEREAWTEAARLAVREATALTGTGLPLHLVGYSNGAALSMKYALDSLEDEKLRRPDRIVLLSPMIGITRFARFAGIAAMPAVLLPFAKAAWQGLAPEYNPYKYNSSTINGAHETYKLTQELQKQIQKLYHSGALLGLPPVLTFQSVLDSTVSTPAIFPYFYEYMPGNGSEIVLFDVNRAADLTPLMNPSARVELAHILPQLPVQYTLTVIANASADEPGELFDEQVTAQTWHKGARSADIKPLGIAYPPDIYSLSHVAVPFPMDDELYGMTPPGDADDAFGISLGNITARGERGMLLVGMDSLFRIMSNPFYSYMVERIRAGIDDPAPQPDVTPHIWRAPGDDLHERETERLKTEEDNSSIFNLSN